MARNREKYNAYHRKYAAEHRAEHRETCAKYRKNKMKPATREKIRAYQKWYYENVTKKKKQQINILGDK
ncbi:MAG: hypothetical protein NC218_03735 [Acetobacter sp.]|nr:hypothetical protein [Acetobacter sp.]